MRGKQIFFIVLIAGFLGTFSLNFMSANASDNSDGATEAERRASDPRNKNYRSGDIYSGYVAMTSQTRDMQDDDFENPAFVLVDTGESLWNKVMGTKGKSCASCHGAA